MRKEVEEMLARLKAGLEERANEEQETRARLMESEEQLRVLLARCAVATLASACQPTLENKRATHVTRIGWALLWCL